MSFFQRMAAVLDHPTLYALWQVPFVGPKLAAVRRHHQLSAARRVLDIGCGPGINAQFFPTADYHGVDLNDRYIAAAQRRRRGYFVVGDARRLSPSNGERYDFVLLNSLLHHLTTEDVQSVLRGAAAMLDQEGHVHILDLVLPEQRGLPRLLALHDRGPYARGVDEWRKIFLQHFSEVVFEPFAIRRFGLNLLQMVYFKGRQISKLSPLA